MVSPTSSVPGRACTSMDCGNAPRGATGRRVLRFAAMAVGCALLIPTTTYAQAITVREENGRKVYVNDDVPTVTVRGKTVPAVRVVHYVYWSSTERRWKPVPAPSPNILNAARYAAAEVESFVSAQPAGPKPDSAKVNPNYRRISRGRVVTSAAIDEAIDEAAAKHNVDPNLVRALVKVESNFNPSAVSRKGAMGLMQLMPSTARELNVTNPFDPEQNVDAGVRHLKHLLESFNGDVPLSLAAYNAGQGAVQRSGGVPPFAETRNYVRRITSLYGRGAVSLSWSGPIRAPIHITRDDRGVLTFTNTD
jgi:Transglycosylase SLT domain